MKTIRLVVFVFSLPLLISCGSAQLKSSDSPAMLAHANESTVVVLEAVRDCATRKAIIADDGFAAIEKTTETVRILCSLTSSRLYGLYERAGLLATESGKESLKKQQNRANIIIKEAVHAHREIMTSRRNGAPGIAMKKAQELVKQCATLNAEMADDYSSDARTIALNLARICANEYNMYIESYAAMAFEDESQRSHLKMDLLSPDKKTESFLAPVIINRKARQSRP